MALTVRDFRRVVSEKLDLPINPSRARTNYRVIADGGRLRETELSLLEGGGKQSFAGNNFEYLL